MYGRTIRDIEAKVRKVKRRSVYRAAFRWGAVLGVLFGVVVDLTVRMPDLQKHFQVYLFIVVSAPICYAMVVGFFLAAVAILTESVFKAFAFLIGSLLDFFRALDPNAIIRDD